MTEPLPASTLADGSVFAAFPATIDRVEEALAVFADCSYGRKCWCAYWYVPHREFKANWGDANRHVLLDRIAAGEEPGLVGLVDGEPASWLSMAPRNRFDRLNRSRSFFPVAGQDPAATWAMNCFITVRRFRRKGLMRAMIESGIHHARRKGAARLEAYPFDANRKPLVDELFIGTAAAFRDCGFVEIDRRLPSRPLMQLQLAP